MILSKMDMFIMDKAWPPDVSKMDKTWQVSWCPKWTE